MVENRHNSDQKRAPPPNRPTFSLLQTSKYEYETQAHKKTTNDLCSFLWTCDFKVNRQQVRESMLATTDTKHCKVKATHAHTTENVTAVSFCFAPCWCLLEFHVTKSGTRTSPNTPPTASTDSWHCKVTSCHHQTLHLRLKVTLQHHIITLRSPNTAPATEALCSTRLVSTLRCSALLYSLFKSPQTWKFLNSTSFDIKYQHISILFHILWVCMYTYHMHSYACITEIPFLNLVTFLKLVRVIVVGLQSWTASPGIS